MSRQMRRMRQNVVIHSWQFKAKTIYIRAAADAVKQVRPWTEGSEHPTGPEEL